MSLLDSMMEQCVYLNHVRTDDNYGSYVEAWTGGATFNATIIKDSTTEAVIAEKQGITEIFTVVTSKSFPLDYHDVFRRVSDGQIFRVTSRAKDSAAPEASTVKIAKVTAEKWVIPNA
jgi:hypothetical protein